MEKERFRNIRLFLGLSQPEFAEYIQVANSTVGNIEAGNRKVSDAVRAKIARVFDVSNEFIEFEERQRRLCL